MTGLAAVVGGGVAAPVGAATNGTPRNPKSGGASLLLDVTGAKGAPR